MKIAIIGYGKMGKEIEKIAIERGHSISLKVTAENANYSPTELADSDAAIEFSIPSSAIQNINKCFEAKVPVVVGTTGWYDQFDAITEKCKQGNNALFYATNFSVGVNIFFELNKKLASLMNPHADYEVSMEEIHHIHKKDAPSGTGITLAEGVLENLDRKSKWVNEEAKVREDLSLISKRIDEVPGTHSIRYESDIDSIEITHLAKNRKGFALGSILAAEWIADKKGVFTMQDMLQL